MFGRRGSVAGYHAEVEGPIYRVIQQQAQKLGCAVLALNGMADHVHLFVKASDAPFARKDHGAGQGRFFRFCQ